MDSITTRPAPAAISAPAAAPGVPPMFLYLTLALGAVLLLGGGALAWAAATGNVTFGKPAAEVAEEKKKDEAPTGEPALDSEDGPASKDAPKVKEGRYQIEYDENA